MPGPLIYYRSDPQGKGRGPGTYYHRGHDKFSKYSVARDKKIIARNPPQARKRYLHTGDVWAGIWKAEELGKKGKWREALRLTGNELPRITGYEPTTLKIRPFPPKTGGLYKWGFYRPSSKEIVVAKQLEKTKSGATFDLERLGELSSPISVLFHEWGHHMHYTSKKPFDPWGSYVGETKRRIESIAEKFELLYQKKIKTKKLAI